MSGPLKPWEIHPALTEGRLREVGRLIWDARVSAADDANWDLGDDLWDIGCKTFSRTRRAVYVAAVADGAYAYLSVRDRTRYFVFSIGGVPIRVYRGDLEHDAPDRYATPDDRELQDLQLACDLFDTPTPGAIFRIAVETDRKGYPTAVRLVQVLPDGSLLNPWRIDLDGPEEVFPLTPEPITPPPPQIGDERQEREREDADAAAQEDSDEQKGA